MSDKTQKTAAEAPEGRDAPKPPLIYDVRIHSLGTGGNLKGTASVSLNGQFAVRGIRIMEGQNGLFVSMPSRKSESGYQDICFPCTKEARAGFDKAVLDAYGQALAQCHAAAEQTDAPGFFEDEPQTGGRAMNLYEG